MRPAGAEPAIQTAASRTALDHVASLAHTAIQLRRELRVLEEPEVVGRDADTLRALLIEVHRAETGIARSLGLEWHTPPDTS